MTKELFYNVKDNMEPTFTLNDAKELEREGTIILTGDTKNRRPLPGYIYLLGSDDGYFKIGCSKNGTTRLNQVKLLMPFKVVLVHKIATADMLGAENFFHVLFSYRRQNGEWFTLDKEEVKFFCSFELIERWHLDHFCLYLGNYDDDQMSINIDTLVYRSRFSENRRGFAHYSFQERLRLQGRKYTIIDQDGVQNGPYDLPEKIEPAFYWTIPLFKALAETD